MKTFYEVFISVFIALCLVALTIIACMCVDILGQQKEIKESHTRLLETNSDFFKWYVTNMEVYETNETQNN